MNRQELENYLKLLGQKLIAKEITGEIILAGGAVMLLVVRNRETTKDIDAYFGDQPEIRIAAEELAREEGLREDWLNDGVKGFFYGNPPQVLWAEYPGLRVYTVHPEYLFAMKVLAGRDSDIEDLQALIIYMKLNNSDEAMQIIEQYVPERLLTVRTKYLIEDLFESGTL